LLQKTVNGGVEFRVNIGHTLSTGSTDSGEVTPSLAQASTKRPQIVSCKGDSDHHRAPAKACWCCRMRSFVERIGQNLQDES